jgi:hypothetical protein
MGRDCPATEVLGASSSQFGRGERRSCRTLPAKLIAPGDCRRGGRAGLLSSVIPER